MWKKNQRMLVAVAGLCAVRELEVHRCVSNTLPSVHFSAVQLKCATRLSTLVSMTQIVLVRCSCAHRESETATSSSTAFLFSSSGKLQNYGGLRELNAPPPQKAHCKQARRVKIQKRFWAHKPSIRRRRGTKRAEADATPAITKNLCQICDERARQITAQGSSAAKLLTCLCCEVLQRVVSICKCFGYLCTFFAQMDKSCVFPRLFCEVEHSWPLSQ